MLQETHVLVAGKYLPILRTLAIASANAATQMIVGKANVKMHVVALAGSIACPLSFGETAYATGYVQLNGLPSDGDTVVITDSASAAITFEFDNTGAVSGGNTLVTIASTVIGTLENLAAAINAIGAGLVVTAIGIEPTQHRVYLRSDTSGTGGNVAITKSGTNIAVVGMTTGAAATTNKLKLDAAALVPFCLPLMGAGYFATAAGSDVAMTSNNTTSTITLYYVEIPVPLVV